MTEFDVVMVQLREAQDAALALEKLEAVIRAAGFQ